ncbi:uncharacterized protein LOC105261868 [Musca domestica]|uniref:Uncharacterized protein LOC105261868 n=1 Tax=Musca domestica TaxID=7370 RepID=A0A1I8NJD9_MUSDO|nr:uncharacterized protein LOC105261868 [Musca domestica]
MVSINLISILMVLALVCSTQAEFSLKATSVDSRKQTSLNLVSTEVNEWGKTLYSYVCTAGENKTESLGCYVKSSNDWPRDQNLELTASCDKSSEAKSIQYVETLFVVSTQNVACSISSGSMRSTYVEVKVNVWGTAALNYTSLFYTN